MNRLDRKFRQLKKQKKKALITFITAGDPNLDVSEKLLRMMEQSGVDVIELGVPFSDPMADGPTIQASSERALRGGVTLPKILKLAGRFRRSSDLPLVLMGYANPIYAMGIARFAAGASKAGVDGVLVVDCPPEESQELVRALRKRGIHLITLIAPTSKPARIRSIAKKAGGFLYYVSMTGITGSQLSERASIKKQVGLIKKETDLPVVVGFGITSAASAKKIARFADGLVVGSALIRRLTPFKRSKMTHTASWIQSLAKVAHHENKYK